MAARAGLTLVIILVASGCLKPGSGDADEDLLTHPEALLRPETYDSILVEVDHAPGFAPTPEALEAMRATLFDVTRKPVTIVGPDEIPLQLGGYRGEDVMRIHRSTFDHAGPEFGYDGQATLHILYLDGPSHNDTFQGVYVSNGLTAAIALLPHYWQDRFPFILAPLLPDDMDEFEMRFERAVLVHEVGHALGLVGTIPEVVGRDDGTGHSVHVDSVMHTGEVPLDEDTMVFLMEQGIEPVWRFDEHDLADLRAFRS